MLVNAIPSTAIYPTDALVSCSMLECVRRQMLVTLMPDTQADKRIST